jgi:hypothetical protein
MEHPMNDPLSLKALPWFLKVFAALIGAVFALVLSGDIDSQGKFKMSLSLLIKLAFSVCISLYGGQAVIEYYHLEQSSSMTHGFIMLMLAVFGMLLVGIAYQAVAMWRGKTLAEIIVEVKNAFAAIFGSKQ